jgi:hypothetical protein
MFFIRPSLVGVLDKASGNRSDTTAKETPIRRGRGPLRAGRFVMRSDLVKKCDPFCLSGRLEGQLGEEAGKAGRA